MRLAPPPPHPAALQNERSERARARGRETHVPASPAAVSGQRTGRGPLPMLRPKCGHIMWPKLGMSLVKLHSGVETHHIPGRFSRGGASPTRTDDLLGAIQIGFIQPCPVMSTKCLHMSESVRPRGDTRRHEETNSCTPNAPSERAAGRRGLFYRALDSAPSTGSDLALVMAVCAIEPRCVLELVHHVAIGAQREACVVAELAGHVDHRSSLVEEERGKRVAVMRNSA